MALPVLPILIRVGTWAISGVKVGLPILISFVVKRSTMAIGWFLTNAVGRFWLWLGVWIVSYVLSIDFFNGVINDLVFEITGQMPQTSRSSLASSMITLAGNIRDVLTSNAFGSFAFRCLGMEHLAQSIPILFSSLIASVTVKFTLRFAKLLLPRFFKVIG